MSNVQVMLPVELAEETEDLGPGDELLTAAELGTLSLFESVKKVPTFDKFPGTTVLRRGTPGRVICTQGEAGATAFYVLTTEDVLRLRERQLESLSKEIEVRSSGDSEAASHLFLRKLTDRQLEARRRELEAETGDLRARIAQLESLDESELRPARHALSANLLVDLDSGRPREGLVRRLLGSFGGGHERESKDAPASIPIDGPSDIDARTMSAPLYESEIFGEMSCMNRAPRAATVTVERDCYLLEMLRNVLDMLQRDPAFRARMDENYRERVMETHVRRLSVFRELSDEEYAQLSDAIQLDVYDAGAVIFEEFDDSDALFVVRSGLVKIIKNVGCRIRDEEMSAEHWSGLCEEFADVGMDGGVSLAAVKRIVQEQLPAGLRDAIGGNGDGRTLEPPHKTELLACLNRFVRTSELHLDKRFGGTKEGLLSEFDVPQLRSTLGPFPDKLPNWSELERRIFYRALLEAAFPRGLPRRLATHGPMRTLAYLGRGDIMGEMGVVLERPRSATCVAYDHPEGYHQRIPDSRTGGVTSRVEVLRISRDRFQQSLESSPRLRRQVDEVVRERGRRSERRRQSESARTTQPSSQSVEFEELGLIQGQRLMLIDLDRCTRCGACVEACVNTHADGRNRLYLDGPRFEKYLVPLTCRSCLDPVCMIGCPVGAINRGDNGEIRIHNWCIACKMCAEQCPYGSIQMNDLPRVELTERQLAVLDPETNVKPVTQRAVVCDLCSSLPSRDPACVYACPHDAALRVNAQEFFF